MVESRPAEHAAGLAMFGNRQRMALESSVPGGGTDMCSLGSHAV